MSFEINQPGMTDQCLEVTCRALQPVDQVATVTRTGRRLAASVYKRIAIYRYTGDLRDPPDAPPIYLPIVGLEFDGQPE